MAGQNISHEGHRQRMRTRVEQYGLESLAPHEVLEYLLYITNARRDTNGIAHALLERHLDTPLTLESIARELCVSRSRLAATYKAERGRGVAEELRDLRMERARELLAGTDLPLSEVGRAVGYPRPSTFATAFSREVGCSPAAWRKQHRL